MIFDLIALIPLMHLKTRNSPVVEQVIAFE